MVHKFDVKNRHKLDNEKRRELLPPEKILIELGLHEGDIMADVGCGIGYFTIPASKIIGKGGMVYAMDILPEMLQDVEIKAKENNLTNVETVLTEENDLKLSDGKITFAFASHVIHEAEDKQSFLAEVRRCISPEGRIAVVEWQKVQGEFGPPVEHRLDKKDLKNMLEMLGFKDVSTMDISSNFYGITAQK